MAMVMMPLVVKARMTEENFAKLIKEAGEKYRADYLIKEYKFDGEYFSMESCEMDDFAIFDEAKMFAKYVEPTDKPIGIIYKGSRSHMVGELYVSNGEAVFPDRVEGDGSLWKEYIADYKKQRKAFLNTFIEHKKGKLVDVQQYLPEVLQPFKEYKLVGTSVSNLVLFLKKELNCNTVSLDADMGRVFVEVDGDYKTEEAEKAIANYYDYKSAHIFTSDGDQDFPEQVMILLLNK